MQSRRARWRFPRRAGGARRVLAASLSLPRRPSDPVTAREPATYALGKGGVAKRSVGPEARRRRWRPGPPLGSPSGLCLACLLRIPGPGPTAGHPSSPSRRGLFTVRRRSAPPAPTPSLPGRGRGRVSGLCKAASSCRGQSEWGGGWACTGPGRGKSPPSLAAPIEHGSLVATLLIAKMRLEGGGNVLWREYILRVPRHLGELQARVVGEEREEWTCNLCCVCLHPLFPSPCNVSLVPLLCLGPSLVRCERKV